MLRKRYPSLLLMAVLVLSGFLSLMTFPDDVSAAEPEFASWSVNPSDPSFDDELNITVTFNVYDVPIDGVEVQVCHGFQCEAPVPMNDIGDGSTFFRVFPPGGFGETTDEVFCYFHFTYTFNSTETRHYPEEPSSTELNVTIVRTASVLEVEASPDRTTVFPNETITVSGKVTNDLGENVSGALVNLTADGLDIFNETYTDPYGEFEVALTLPEEGNRTLNLTVTDNDLAAYREWSVRVNSWPIPVMSITGTLDFNEDARPVGGGEYEFYEGSEVTLVYDVMNTGTGNAYNITAFLDISNEEAVHTVNIGNLTPSPTQRYQGEFPLNTSLPGIIDVNITLEWDQDAPEDQKIPYTPFSIELTMVPVPTWENHRVLVEMFTQTTCVPCVDVEEAVERLNEEENLDFEFIMYVYDDQASQLRANELGVTSTPDLFIDHTYDRMTGGGSVDEMMEEIRSRIENASLRDTPPVEMRFSESGDGEIGVSLYLSDVYSSRVSGIFQVYSIETNSNVRNYQGIPIAHRYHGAAAGEDISEMNPGSYRNLTVPSPDHGMGYVAVLLASDGKVLQSASYIPPFTQELYMKEGSSIIRSESPASLSLNLSLEKFQFEDSDFPDVGFEVWAEGIPGNWSLSIGGGEVTDAPSVIFFSKDAAEREELPSGRIRYSEVFGFQLRIPEGDGTYSFKLHVNSSGTTFTWTYVLIITPADSGGTEPANPIIDDVYLESAGGKLYIYVEARNVPENATVKARVLPCNEGENALCGLPVDFVLIPIQDERYRVSLTGVDLESYTHLTYHAWIERDGVKLVSSTEKKEAIDGLIEIPSAEDGSGNEKDNTSLYVFLFGVPVVLIILAALLFILLKRSGEKGEAEEETQEPAGTETLPGDEMPEASPVEGEAEPTMSGEEDPSGNPPAEVVETEGAGDVIEPEKGEEPVEPAEEGVPGTDGPETLSGGIAAPEMEDSPAADPGTSSVDEVDPTAAHTG